MRCTHLTCGAEATHVYSDSMAVCDFHYLHTQIRSKRCPSCGDTKVLTVTKAEWHSWLSDSSQLIQNVFRSLSDDDRERLITGYCPKCWDALFMESSDED